MTFILSHCELCSHNSYQTHNFQNQGNLAKLVFQKLFDWNTSYCFQTLEVYLDIHLQPILSIKGVIIKVVICDDLSQ